MKICMFTSGRSGWQRTGYTFWMIRRWHSSPIRGPMEVDPYIPRMNISRNFYVINRMSNFPSQKMNPKTQIYFFTSTLIRGTPGILLYTNVSTNWHSAASTIKTTWDNRLRPQSQNYSNQLYPTKTSLVNCITTTITTTLKRDNNRPCFPSTKVMTYTKFKINSGSNLILSRVAVVIYCRSFITIAPACAVLV